MISTSHCTLRVVCIVYILVYGWFFITCMHYNPSLNQCVNLGYIGTGSIPLQGVCMPVAQLLLLRVWRCCTSAVLYIGGDICCWSIFGMLHIHLVVLFHNCAQDLYYQCVHAHAGPSQQIASRLLTVPHFSIMQMFSNPMQIPHIATRC